MTSASELEAAGEDAEGLIEDAAKLYDTVKKLTTTKANPDGISILTETGDFKSTYQILLEISKVWDSLSDKSQASLLETLAGKNRANVVSGILQAKDENGDPLMESIYNASLASTGAAAEAMETALSSIESAQARMQNAWQSAFQNTGAETAITDFYNVATSIAEVVDKLGLLKTALGAVGFAGFFKLFKSSDAFKSLDAIILIIFSITRGFCNIFLYNIQIGCFLLIAHQRKLHIESFLPIFTQKSIPKISDDFINSHKKASSVLKELIKDHTDATKIEEEYNAAIE